MADNSVASADSHTSCGVKCRSSGFSNLVHSKTLEVTQLIETWDSVCQILMVNDKLWGLTDKNIHVYDPETGQHVDVVHLEFTGLAWDMALSDSGHIVIATSEQLLVVNIHGHVIQTIQGKYKAVTRSTSEEGCVWAVRVVEEAEWYRKSGKKKKRAWLVKFRVSATGAEEMKRVKTHIKKGFTQYCTELNHHLIISSLKNHCILVLDTRLGSQLTSHGKEGQGDAGELQHPLGVYSDPESGSALVMDQFNQRLQILNLKSGSWAVVKTMGDRLQHPAVAVQHGNNIWICGGTGPNYIYKCRVLTDDE